MLPMLAMGMEGKTLIPANCQLEGGDPSHEPFLKDMWYNVALRLVFYCPSCADVTGRNPTTRDLEWDKHYIALVNEGGDAPLGKCRATEDPKNPNGSFLGNTEMPDGIRCYPTDSSGEPIGPYVFDDKFFSEACVGYRETSDDVIYIWVIVGVFVFSVVVAIAACCWCCKKREVWGQETPCPRVSAKTLAGRMQTITPPVLETNPDPAQQDHYARSPVDTV